MDNTDPGRPGPHTCSPTLGGCIESTPVLPTHTKLCTHGPQNHRETVAVGFFPSFLRFQTSRIFCSLRPLSAFPRSESSLLPSPLPFCLGHLYLQGHLACFQMRQEGSCLRTSAVSSVDCSLVPPGSLPKSPSWRASLTAVSKIARSFIL